MAPSGSCASSGILLGARALDGDECTDVVAGRARYPEVIEGDGIGRIGGLFRVDGRRRGGGVQRPITLRLANRVVAGLQGLDLGGIDEGAGTQDSESDAEHLHRIRVQLA